MFAVFNAVTGSVISHLGQLIRLIASLKYCGPVDVLELLNSKCSGITGQLPTQPSLLVLLS